MNRRLRHQPPPPAPPPPLPDPLHLEPMAYCVEDAALVMGLTRTAVYAMIKEGRLKSIREGRRRIIPRSAIQAYLDSNAA